MLSLSDDNQSEIIETFNSTSRYLDDLLNIDNNFFYSMVNHIYPSKLQLNKANVTEASFFIYIYLYLYIDKRDIFDLDILNFPLLDGDVPHSTSYGVSYSFCSSVQSCRGGRVV